MIEQFNPVYNPNAMFNNVGYRDLTSRFSRGISFFDTLGLHELGGFGREIVLSLDSMNGLAKAYRDCAPLGSVINKIAEATTNGIWTVKDVASQDSISERYTNIVELLNNPNPIQTYHEFLAQLKIYILVYGHAYIYANVPTKAGRPSEAKTLWVVSPENVEVKLKAKLYNAQSVTDIVESYDIRYYVGDNKEKSVTASPLHVLHVTDTYEKLGTQDDIFAGQSRITSLEYEIRNIIQAHEAIYALNRDRGAQGIISNDKRDGAGYIPLTPDERKDLHKEWSMYGIDVNRPKMIISDAAVKYTPIGYDVKGLMLFEGIRENIMQICDAYNYPFTLIASEKGKTAADQKVARKMLYEDNIIPSINRITEKMSTWFGFNIRKEKIVVDYSHLDVFQEGNVDRNTALRQMAQALHILYNGQAITREEYRRAMGFNAEMPDGTMYEDTGATFARDDIRITDE